jgi:hypothetical protein
MASAATATATAPAPAQETTFTVYMLVELFGDKFGGGVTLHASEEAGVAAAEAMMRLGARWTPMDPAFGGERAWCCVPASGAYEYTKTLELIATPCPLPIVLSPAFSTTA